MAASGLWENRLSLWQKQIVGIASSSIIPWKAGLGHGNGGFSHGPDIIPPTAFLLLLQDLFLIQTHRTCLPKSLMACVPQRVLPCRVLISHRTSVPICPHRANVLINHKSVLFPNIHRATFSRTWYSRICLAIKLTIFALGLQKPWDEWTVLGRSSWRTLLLRRGCGWVSIALFLLAFTLLLSCFFTQHCLGISHFFQLSVLNSLVTFTDLSLACPSFLMETILFSFLAECGAYAGGLFVFLNSRHHSWLPLQSSRLSLLMCDVWVHLAPLNISICSQHLSLRAARFCLSPGGSPGWWNVL